MSGLAPIRRFVIGVLVFGGFMAVVVWRAGGLTPSDDGRNVRDPALAAQQPDDAVVPIAGGPALGQGRDVRVSRDGVAVVEGTPITFRAWEASWSRHRPLAGETVDEQRLLTEDFSVLLFHRRPTAADPRPAAIEGPDTTRIDADDAELELGGDAAFNATLTGSVRIVRHETDGDLVMTTESLDVEHTGGGSGSEDVRATSDERVRVVLDRTEQSDGAELEGTGLDADLRRAGGGDDSERTRVTLRNDVQAQFLAPQGAATGQGSDDTAELVLTTITCDDAATLENLQPGTERRPARWLATFRRNAVVVQAPSTLHCQTLEVEFQVAPRGRTRGGLDILRVVADGDVLVEGEDAAEGSRWSLRTQKSVTRRDAKGGYDVDLLGGTTLAFDGTLRGRSKGTTPGRVEISCAGPAKLHSDAKPARPNDPIRGRISFHDDVAARQWVTKDGEEILETEVRAPEITIFGSRLHTGDGRLDPETLTATGTDTERVHVRRETVTADTRNLTWRVMRDQDRERLLLSGRPAVRLEETSGASLLGRGKEGDQAVLLLNALDSIEILRRHTPPAEGAGPSDGYATVKARNTVVMRRLLDERETYRLTANSVDGAFDSDWQPTNFRAYDKVVITGQGDVDGDRQVELRGDRLSADIQPATTAGERWTQTTVHVFGQAGKLAKGTFSEPTEEGEKPRRSEIEAEHLSYEESGTLVTARRRARVLLERFARDPISKESTDATITGGLLKIRLRPPGDAPEGRPELIAVEGERGVTLAAPRAVVTGQTLTWDHVSGIATATGRPARVVLRHASAGQEQAEWVGRVGELDSLVTSEEIRAEFDTTGKSNGRPRRVLCTGGRLRFFQFEKADRADSTPALVNVKTTGPIEVLPGSASASGDVEITWDTRLATGRFDQRARVLADRVELAFDENAEGPFRDRVTKAIATGTRNRPARLFTPKIDATADRVESDGAWIDLLSPWGRRVRVTQRDPPESFTCRKARYNYLTTAFEATGADYTQPASPDGEKR